MAKKQRKCNLKARLEKNEERKDFQTRIRSDRIITPPSTNAFRRGYERTFGHS